MSHVSSLLHSWHWCFDSYHNIHLHTYIQLCPSKSVPLQKHTAACRTMPLPPCCYGNAAVMCTITPVALPAGNFDLRLADGRRRHEGRLEIFYDGAWGNVCWDEAWYNYQAGGGGDQVRGGAWVCAQGSLSQGVGRRVPATLLPLWLFRFVVTVVVVPVCVGGGGGLAAALAHPSTACMRACGRAHAHTHTHACMHAHTLVHA